VAHPVAFHPGRSIPPEPAKASLDAVAALLRAQRQILLVRIEAYGSHAAAKSAEAQRREIDASQSRADAVLEYLWRRRGISAERLEAVGYGSHPRFVGRAPRWHIVLRVMQRSEKVPSASPVR
jgi:outer membrane protein OmpA-like peptidoglycan-associated protein